MHAPDLGSSVQEAVHDVAQTVKPKLRGWLHAGTFPLSVVAGIVIVVLAPSTEAKIATGIFALTASLLFGVSALYHRGHWSPRAAGVLRRLDHANIFLIIAGTYTPFTLLLLDKQNAKVLLAIVWGGALLGVAFRVLWLGAPRWLYVPVYIAVGWAAAFWLPDFFDHGRGVVFAMILTGGLLYSAGAIVYATKRPNPSPRWFGFHEVFHAFTVLAFIAHYVGVSLTVYS
ncbi:hemolysin III [Actinopolymorpha cephalotaxi]|uniref:Hemolysin III n=1 Tax=Actinopolymorpha cephalotaxi TaxID=504797 RepID=A0A1I2NJT4_9ACTN|nr:hemolysin III family protein [Actinopolymorpha cephalotaxi]NYH85484.1 hemolysin III [Actinopolymorpha cephalotaxi]SFG03898.1 hemolysin III [Actinopolymorpha cephalotaxi]